MRRDEIQWTANSTATGEYVSLERPKETIEWIVNAIRADANLVVWAKCQLGWKENSWSQNADRREPISSSHLGKGDYMLALASLACLEALARIANSEGKKDWERVWNLVTSLKLGNVGLPSKEGEFGDVWNLFRNNLAHSYTVSQGGIIESTESSADYAGALAEIEKKTSAFRKEKGTWYFQPEVLALQLIPTIGQLLKNL